MANLSNSVPKILTPISIKLPRVRSHPSTFSFTNSSQFKVQAASSSSSSNKDDNLSPQLVKKKNFRKKVPRAPRPLVTISTSSGRWHGQWSCDYVLTLRELQLADLAEDGEKDAAVFVSLTIQKPRLQSYWMDPYEAVRKVSCSLIERITTRNLTDTNLELLSPQHASFGFSVDGRIITSFNRKCSSCFSPYCREIDTTFDVWVLPSSRTRESELPEIGGNDPSVLYVTPGSEADLDSLIQDTIRLTASTKDTCSESCEKSTIVWQYTDGKNSYDQRWSRLLKIKNAI